ncbi:MAG: hypothetical protein N3I35_03975 [Clostridia bacterium]|nr:hypothetical protein [Clostridia bacterium]
MDVYKSIKNRISIRKYSGKIFDEETIGLVKEKLEGLIPLYEDIKVRFELVTDPETSKSLQTGLIGSYGKINAPHCVVAVTEEKPGHKENIGFIQEQLVLELTDMGIGTCWVAGSLDRDKAGKAIELKEGEKVIDIITLGYPQDSFLNNGLRKIIGSHKRRPRNEVAYYNKWGEDIEAYLNMNPSMTRMLEASILAPSAANKQPVRVVLCDNSAAFFVQEDQGAHREYARVDGGILLSHFYLSALKEGKKAGFCKEINALEKYTVPTGYGYITTLKLD